MNKFFVVIILVTFFSCSIEKMIAKTPKLKLDKYKTIKHKYKSDARYFVDFIKENYPRLDFKVSNFDSIAKIYYEKISNSKDDDEFQFYIQSLISKLKDGHSYISNRGNSKDPKLPIYLYRNQNFWVIGNIDNAI